MEEIYMTNQAQAAEKTKTISAIPHKSGGFVLRGQDCEGVVYQTPHPRRMKAAVKDDGLRMWAIEFKSPESEWGSYGEKTAQEALASLEDMTGMRVVVEPPPPPPAKFADTIDEYCRGYRDGLDMGYDEGMLAGFADGYVEGYAAREAHEARKARKAKMGRLPRKSSQDPQTDTKNRMRKAKAKHLRDLMDALVPLKSDEYYYGFRQGAGVGFEHGYPEGIKDGRSEGYEACASGHDPFSGIVLGAELDEIDW
jgi:hypothetical protein